MPLLFLHDSHAARPSLQNIPDFQQAAFSIFTPLMIPEAQFSDVLICQEFRAGFVVLDLFRGTVVKAIEFNRKLGLRAVEIQGINSDRMLSPKFETSKAVAAQRAPKLFLFVGLVAAKSAGSLNRVHTERMRAVGEKSSPSPPTLSPFGGEREKNVT